METTQHDAEILVEEQQFDDRVHTLFATDTATRPKTLLLVLDRRQKFAAAVLLVAMTTVALGVASVVAVGALGVVAPATLWFVVGLATRSAIAISQGTDRC